MSREIRITIDDDEVFERLKRRKRDLDLSWEEALRRGLEERGPARPPRPPSPPSADRGGEPDDRSRRGGPRRDERRGATAGPFDPAFGDRLERRIRESVADSLGAVEGALEAVGESPDLADEIGRLEEAEDAVLAFDWLAEEESARVPLRVTLETTPGGLDASVVAVRRGKGTDGMNRFADDVRRVIAEGLVAGEIATLSLQDGAERYDVVPVLSWTRDADGTPAVTDVEIADVRFE